MFESTCFDLWRKEVETEKIITLCKHLDNSLCGGISNGITEFCGAPGSGKTQFCLQLSINVQFPEEVGGVNGKAVYLDTNQGFNPLRFNEIATYMEQRFNRTFANIRNDLDTSCVFNVTSLLKGVLYTYCSNYVQLIAAVTNLRTLLADDQQIKLIIIDSFAFPLRSIEDVSQRTRIVYEILTELQQLSLEYNLAVVITNELTTRQLGANWTIVPALGNSHTHKINTRIILSKELDKVYHLALVDKFVTSPKVIIPFEIKKSGVRGLESKSS